MTQPHKDTCCEKCDVQLEDDKPLVSCEHCICHQETPQTTFAEKKVEEMELMREIMYGKSVDFSINADGSVLYPHSGQLYLKIRQALEEARKEERERIRSAAESRKMSQTKFTNDYVDGFNDAIDDLLAALNNPQEEV